MALARDSDGSSDSSDDSKSRGKGVPTKEVDVGGGETVTVVKGPASMVDFEEPSGSSGTSGKTDSGSGSNKDDDKKKRGPVEDTGEPELDKVDTGQEGSGSSSSGSGGFTVEEEGPGPDTQYGFGGRWTESEKRSKEVAVRKGELEEEAVDVDPSKRRFTVTASEYGEKLITAKERGIVEEQDGELVFAKDPNKTRLGTDLKKADVVYQVGKGEDALYFEEHPSKIGEFKKYQEAVEEQRQAVKKYNKNIRSEQDTSFAEGPIKDRRGRYLTAEGIMRQSEKIASGEREPARGPDWLTYAARPGAGVIGSFTSWVKPETPDVGTAAVGLAREYLPSGVKKGLGKLPGADFVESNFLPSKEQGLEEAEYLREHPAYFAGSVIGEVSQGILIGKGLDKAGKTVKGRLRTGGRSEIPLDEIMPDEAVRQGDLPLYFW